MIRSANLCDICDAPTAEPEDSYGEFVCTECQQNRAEAAYERLCSDFHGGSGPLPLRDQQIQAMKFK